MEKENNYVYLVSKEDDPYGPPDRDDWMFTLDDLRASDPNKVRIVERVWLTMIRSAEAHDEYRVNLAPDHWIYNLKPEFADQLSDVELFSKRLARVFFPHPELPGWTLRNSSSRLVVYNTSIRDRPTDEETVTISKKEYEKMKRFNLIYQGVTYFIGLFVGVIVSMGWRGNCSGEDGGVNMTDPLFGDWVNASLVH